MRKMMIALMAASAVLACSIEPAAAASKKPPTAAQMKALKTQLATLKKAQKRLERQIEAMGGGSPRAIATPVEGTGVLADWKGGSIQLIAEEHMNVGAGHDICALFLEVDTLEAPTVFYPTENEWDLFELDPHTNLLEAQVCDGEECTIAYSPALARTDEPGTARSSAFVHEFATSDHLSIRIENAAVAWDFNGADGCVGSANLTVEQR